MKYSIKNLDFTPARQSSKRTAILAILLFIILAGFGIRYWHKSASPLVNRSLPTAVQSQAPPTAKGYGIAAGSSLPDLSDAQLEQRMADIQALGTSWIRFDFDWSNIQPDDNGQYDWKTYDRIVAAANRHNLKVLGIITYTPAWARADGCEDIQCPPLDNNKFAAFAGAVAAHYKDQGVHAWEIWNEPNNPDFWKPKADPAAYTDLLAKSFNAVHTADKVALVITGGLSPQSTSSDSFAPVDFLQAIYKNGAKPYFDAVGDHPYTFPQSPASSENHAWNQMAASNNSMRSIMEKNGDNSKKIWITEFGSPTGGPGPIATVKNPRTSQHPYVVDQALQAKILSDAISLYKTYDWAGPFFYYSYKDAGTTPDTNENFFGLIGFDGSKKPAYTILQQAASSQK